MKALPKRNQVAIEETWDLTLLFPTEEDYEREVAAIQKEVDAFCASEYSSAVDSKTLQQAIRAYDSLCVRIQHASLYPELAISSDYGDPQNQARAGQAQLVFSACFTKLSKFSSHLDQLPKTVLEQLIEEDKEYAHFWQRLLLKKPHQLSPACEELIVSLSPALELPVNTYETNKMADLRFKSFEVDGKEYPLDFVTFENEYQFEPNTKLRRAAYEAFGQGLDSVANTYATIYNAQVQKEKILATARGYDSVFDYLLDEQEVDRADYEIQIDTIYRELGPILQRYQRLLQRVHNWDVITHADLKTPLDPDYSVAVTLPEAKAYVLEALSILGEDYAAVVTEALENRWIDFAKNEGKSTGGFCASAYGGNSFILMSWNGLLSEVFTLVHELGHALHFNYSMQNQPFSLNELSLYLIEAPSTCNEMLLSRILLQKKEDLRYRRWVLSSMIENTYYHNFVTHLLEAHFQRKVYQAVDRGEALHLERFNEMMEETLRGFWGETVQWTPGIEATWMRQPHYYMGLYSYTYSAGLTLSTIMSQRIVEEGQPAIEAWKGFLRAGGSDRPIDLVKKHLDIDLRTGEALRQTLAFIDQTVKEIEALTDAIEAESEAR